jgi:hypothetical protein
LAVASPVAASAAAVTTATGIAGTSSIEELVTSVAWSAWPVLSLIAGLAISALGVGVLLTSRRWPGSTRKYQAIRVEPATSDRSSVDDWDSLTRGGDPTQ